MSIRREIYPESAWRSKPCMHASVSALAKQLLRKKTVNENCMKLRLGKRVQNYYIRENVLMTIRLAVVIQPATSSWQVNNPGDNLWPSDIVKMNAFSRSGRRKLINETRNSMIPEVFPMIQSSNDSFLQLERWVKKIHCFEGWPCYWDEFVWPGFRRWKYAYPCLASSTNTWRAWARYLLKMNCILLMHI